MDTLKLGQLITTEQGRDATHIAVAPVIAGENLTPSTHIGFLSDEKVGKAGQHIGIVDPFLKMSVRKGDKFWLYLYPGSITSLEHKWSHPAFSEKQEEKSATDISYSEKWMRKWASGHMSYDYYGDGNLSEEISYQKAIDAGHNLSVGPYESARDHIDDIWWTHWEIITDCKRPKEDVYFSCGC